MRQILENIEAGDIQAEMARRGVRPRQRVRVVFEVIADGVSGAEASGDEDIPTAEMAEGGGAFDWLADEPDLYTIADVKTMTDVKKRDA